MHHLYEIVLDSLQMWLKLQASCSSHEQATAFFEHRFGGHAPHLARRPDLVYVTFSFLVPKKLPECADHIFNLEDIKDDLPTGWDDQEFRIVGGPYPWCETLSEGCDCHGRKGRLDAAYCSSFGSHDESAERASKSPNVRHAEYVTGLRRTLVKRQAARKASQNSVANALPQAHAQEGFYCQIDGRYHDYSEQVKQKVVADMRTLRLSLTTWSADQRKALMSHFPTITEHHLRRCQSHECAERYVTGTTDVPDVVYKYIPRDRIGQGAPRTLRATQISALNDDMECNVTVMNDTDMDVLDFLDLVQSKLQEHLGVTIPDEELMERALRYGNMRLSPFFQEHLNERVGVISFSTDLLVPTMWSHYAQNTGIVVGYDTEALREFGLELRPVQYSEFAPTYMPARDDVIRMVLADRDRMERDRLAGVPREGIAILGTAYISRMGAGWEALSPILFIKGMSWEYEKEVRLLVDLEDARDIGESDANGWPVKVLDVPPDAVKEIYGGDRTAKADIRRAIEVARGENLAGLFEGNVSSDVFRIQNTGGFQH